MGCSPARAAMRERIICRHDSTRGRTALYRKKQAVVALRSARFILTQKGEGRAAHIRVCQTKPAPGVPVRCSRRAGNVDTGVEFMRGPDVHGMVSDVATG